MALVYIGLGSNEGDSCRNIQNAWKKMAEAGFGVLLGLSAPYKSEPVGVDTENWFVDAVGVIETRLAPEALLVKMLAIEKELGRDRSKGVDRCIDLDMLYYDDLVLMTPQLVLPHPGIQDRLFVLLPLAELAPDHIHPVLGKSTSMMRKGLVSGKIVQKTTWD